MKIVDVTREMHEEQVAGPRISLEKLSLGQSDDGGNKRNTTYKHSLYPEFWRKTQSNPILKAKTLNSNANKKKSSIISISSNGSSKSNNHKQLIYPAKFKYTSCSNHNVSVNLPTSPPLIVRNGNLVQGTGTGTATAANSTIKSKLDELSPVKNVNLSKTKLQPIQEESHSTNNSNNTTASGPGTRSNQLVYPIPLSPTISLTNFKSLSLVTQPNQNQNQISLAETEEEKKTANTNNYNTDLSSNEVKKSSSSSSTGHSTSGSEEKEKEKEREKQKIIAKRPLKWKARIKISRPEHFNKSMIQQQQQHHHHHKLTPIPEELINRADDDEDDDSDDSLLNSPTTSFQVLRLTNNSSCSKQAMMETDADALIDEELASRVGGIYIMSTQAEMMYI